MSESPSAAPRPEGGLSAAEKLFRIRHSASHILAQAVLEIFPDARLAIGPPVADGFYYDFDLPRPLTPEDLADIEQRMQRIVKANAEFRSSSRPAEEAIRYFEEKKQPYKVELIRDLGVPEVSFYQHDEFTDLCAGPHVRRTGECKAFKLLRVAGAYWRGDSSRPMLQRVYGTAWRNKADLDAYLEMLEEAKKRDHRKVGRELDLFSFHRESPGAAFWHPKGWALYRELQSLWRELHGRSGYVEIANPIVYHRSLYDQSGHWEHYQEHMFKLESEGETFCVKPMNCPDTMLFYKTRKHSYRDLPLRVSEGQLLHRNELSGALSGLFRVRQFTQDDAHIFVAPDQIEAEIGRVVSLIRELYGIFQLEFRVKLSTRPESFMGDPALWDEAEAALARALDANGMAYRVNAGDGAFYGPKIDFDVLDSLGRKWQCATVQLDFQLPRRFDLTYTANDNSEQIPVVIHRALFGSFERFIGILVEHFAGAFPTWLAPVQAILLPLSDDFVPLCQERAQRLRALGVRADVDARAGTLGYKIREAELARIPRMLVVGRREAEQGTYGVRSWQDGDRGPQPVADVENDIVAAIRSRAFDVTLKKLQWGQEESEDEERSSTY